MLKCYHFITVDGDVRLREGGVERHDGRDRWGAGALRGHSSCADRRGAGLRGLGTEAALCRGRSGTRDTRLDARERSLGGRGASTRVFL